MKRRPHFVPALAVAVMLLVAVASLPYGYFQFLRWATCAVAIYVAVMSYRWNRKWATWVFGAVAILFNPILPVYLTKEIWRPIDLSCAAIFLLSIALLREPNQAHP